MKIHSGNALVINLQRNFILVPSHSTSSRSSVGLYVGLYMVAFTLSLAPTCLIASSSRAEPFGVTSTGQNVSRITLANDANMTVSIINYGATLTSIEVPDRTGRVGNIVLSLPNMAAYERTERRWGGIIGRYAGRIGGARFELDGKRHNLEVGRNGVTLHGGARGYDKRVWAFKTRSNARSVSAIFTLASPDGDQGFPGALVLEVTYRLMRASNEMRIEYRARTNAPTFVNFTNHAFINLAGAGTGTIRDHELTLFADRYAPTNAVKVPSGELLSVAGTPLDFRTATRIGKFIDSVDPLLLPSKGFDHSYVASQTPSLPGSPIAIVKDALSGRTMTLTTTEPSLQFNSGNGFEGKEIGSEGIPYPTHAGIALETQHLPDSPNKPQFPSTRLDRSKRFFSTTTYQFSID